MTVSTTEQQEVVDRFLGAVRHGDLQGFLDVLAPDVVADADGGGLVAAARRPIEGAKRVARLLIAASRGADVQVKAIWLNGSPGVRVDIGGEVAAMSLSVENGRITRIYVIANPTSWPGSTGSLRSHGPDRQVISLRHCLSIGSAPSFVEG